MRTQRSGGPTIIGAEGLQTQALGSRTQISRVVYARSKMIMEIEGILTEWPSPEM